MIDSRNILDYDLLCKQNTDFMEEKIIMEILKGLGILDTSFLVPIIIVIVVLIIIAMVAKKILKFALLIALIALVATIYLNLPSFKVDNGTATLDLYGKQHTISLKDIKIVSEQKDGDTKTVLVSGTERIVLPFSKDFADKFIMDKLQDAK